MNNYNFLNLSPFEFEVLSRDLLQIFLGLTLESFAIGRDKGIDLRYLASGENEIIVQCKRYDNYNSLMKSLKEEVPKLHKLQPKRYLITTSVGLSPIQKEKITKIFNPYILNENDIFGREDLNNFLSIYTEIEKKHFKLWLSSVNILENIIHSKVINQTYFEEKNILYTVKTYVQNESFESAIKILNKYNYIIISGVPGIGKSTLAKFLVYYFLGNGFKEFIYLSDSINEGYSTFKIGVKQVFLFDDFLGSNFINNNLQSNEEQRIYKFIEMVSGSKDKLLIFTTREYILAQAKLKYEIFQRTSIDVAKTIIDVSQYTSIIRAKILYNHLFFSEIPNKYISKILEDNSFLLIIKHPNFNPRIIETFTNPYFYKSIKPNEYLKYFLEALDYPDRVWKHVYENQISNVSQCLLALLMSSGDPILIEDFRLMFQSFASIYYQKYGIIYSETVFSKSILELENTFIRTEKDTKNQTIVNFLNPSVQDFLVNHFRNSQDLLLDIINSAIFFNQLFNVFIVEMHYERMNKYPSEKLILLNENNKLSLVNRISNDFKSLGSSRLIAVYSRYTISNYWEREEYSDLNKINRIASEYNINDYPQIKNTLKLIFESYIIPYSLRNQDISVYQKCLVYFEEEFEYNDVEILDNYLECMYSLSSILKFRNFKGIFSDIYDEYIKSDKFKNSVIDLVYENASDLDKDLLDETIIDIELIRDDFNIDFNELLTDLYNKLNSYEEELKHHDEVEYEEPSENDFYNMSDDILDLFDSIRKHSK